MFLCVKIIIHIIDYFCGISKLLGFGGFFFKTRCPSNIFTSRKKKLIVSLLRLHILIKSNVYQRGNLTWDPVTVHQWEIDQVNHWFCLSLHGIRKTISRSLHSVLLTYHNTQAKVITMLSGNEQWYEECPQMDLFNLIPPPKHTHTHTIFY